MRERRDYATVTGAYWAFTVTDGALRMLVLLYLHDLGYSPIAIASLFLFYEFFGVVTNLVGGWLGARFGLTRTLFAGLALQIVACGSLAVSAVRVQRAGCSGHVGCLFLGVRLDQRAAARAARG